jgi:crossover junction endodeoxyribonuclease RuvC
MTTHDLSPPAGRVLGIDPGLRMTGYACLASAYRPSGGMRGGGIAAGSAVAHLVEAGVLRLNARLSISDRLAELDADLQELIERLRPEAIAVEKLYAHYKHPTTAIIMGHARGVVLLNVRKAGLRLVELGATEVKKSLTGNGHAGKAQMQDGVRTQLRLTARPEPADVADAAAIALCALRRGALQSAPVRGATPRPRR